MARDKHAFGSVPLELYLPNGNVDITFFGIRAKLHSVRDELSKANIAVERTLLVDNATTPAVLTFTDRKTKVKVNIVFHQQNAMRCMELMTKFNTKYPQIPFLLLTVKQFLTEQQQLNGASGIDSYTLYLMLVHFLQRVRIDGITPNQLANPELGLLLIEFFDYYGRIFNHWEVGISISRGGCIFGRNQMHVDNAFLYIRDPLNPERNASGRCFGYLQVKQSFQYACHRLRSVVYPRSSTPTTCPSILGEIMQIPVEVDEYRSWIESKWSSTASVARPETPLIVSPEHQILTRFSFSINY